MKKSLVIVTVVFAVAALMVTPAEAAKKAKYKIRLSNVVPQQDHIGKGYDKFAELVEQKSDGEVKVNVFHGGQLGSGKETFEAAKAGFIEMASDSYANIVTLTPAFEPFHLPYIFESRKQELAAFKSDAIRDRIDKMLESIGLKWLVTFEFGPRQICTTKKKVLVPDDLKGLKLRASRSPLEIAAHKSWGAASMTIDWPEVFDALRMGMIDGYTVTLDAVWSVKHYELIKYIGVLSFQVYGDVAVCNKAWWDKLPPETQKLITEAAREAEAYHEKILTDYVNMNIREMKAAGTDIYGYSKEQKAAFKQEAMKVWDQFSGTTCPKDYVDFIVKEIGPPGDGGWGFEY